MLTVKPTDIPTGIITKKFNMNDLTQSTSFTITILLLVILLSVVLIKIKNFSNITGLSISKLKGVRAFLIVFTLMGFGTGLLMNFYEFTTKDQETLYIGIITLIFIALSIGLYAYILNNSNSQAVWIIVNLTIIIAYIYAAVAFTSVTILLYFIALIIIIIVLNWLKNLLFKKW